MVHQILVTIGITKFMMSEQDQLVKYISEQLRQGISEDNIRQSLVQNNWDEKLVNQAFTLVRNPEYTTSNLGVTSQQSNVLVKSHKVRNGVLWILSPFIVFVGTALVNIIVRFAGINSSILNIVFVLAGMVGVILIFVGPVLGIIELTRHK